MFVEIRKSWLGRWAVYEIGHMLGDETWLASFRHLVDAEHYANPPRRTARDPSPAGRK